MTKPDELTVPAYLQSHVVRLCQNLARVDSLLELFSFADGLITQYKEHPLEFRKGSFGRLPEVDDVLRSAIVLLHASLEDFVRTIAAAHLPQTKQDLLKNIPLAGGGNQRQPKFGLGDLIPHRNKTVEEIIEASIHQWLNQHSFNNSTDLAVMLTNIGIDPATCSQSFASLDEMIARRHRIVHNADLSPDQAHIPEMLPIDRDTVRQWRVTVQQFMQAVLHQLQFVVEAHSDNAK